MKWTDAERELLTERYLAGEPLSLIAWRFGRGLRAIDHQREKLGLTRDRLPGGFVRRERDKAKIDSLSAGEKEALGYIARDFLHSDWTLSERLDRSISTVARLYKQLAAAGVIAIRRKPGAVGRTREVKLTVPRDMCLPLVPEIERPPSTHKKRNCLMCGGAFNSRGPGERVCMKCKQSSAWSSPALAQETAGLW